MKRYEYVQLVPDFGAVVLTYFDHTNDTGGPIQVSVIPTEKISEWGRAGWRVVDTVRCPETHGLLQVLLEREIDEVVHKM